MTYAQQNGILVYSKKFGRDPSNNFAAACADQNSTQELLDSLQALPDPADVSAWSLTGGEWHAAIRAALAERDIPA